MSYFTVRLPEKHIRPVLRKYRKLKDTPSRGTALFVPQTVAGANALIAMGEINREWFAAVVKANPGHYPSPGDFAILVGYCRQESAWRAACANTWGYTHEEADDMAEIIFCVWHARDHFWRAVR